MQDLVEIAWIGQQPEHAFIDEPLHAGLIVLLLHRDAVDKEVRGVAAEFLLGFTAGLGPFLLVDALEDHRPAVEGERALYRVLQIVGLLAMLIQGLDLEGRGVQAVLAEEGPGEGVEDGGLAQGVGGIDVGFLPEFHVKGADTLEVPNLNAFD